MWVLRRYSYYWKDILKDCIEFAKTCIVCQEHCLVQRVPAINTQPIVKIWPFRGWALDFIEKLRPLSTNGYTYMVVAIDYFTTWVEAIPLKTCEQSTVINFIKKHIIHRFGILRTLTINRSLSFVGSEVIDYCAECGIQVISSTPYFAQANVQVEASNKVILNILEQMIENHPKEWHHLLSEALWAYRFSKRSSTGFTP
ncbi:uncharacterized protein LOC132301653 [Cornus florida]|uniref:uncharacterized protein LOC132301653 n=1 Tax=Cornus florida TaxID=4283 RepID=UPI002898B87E|nr:uncharacterized protein LOC132301653 [Cornus florida]